MILANEAVAGLLGGRKREALYRVHERPDPQSVELLLAKLAELEVPTPPAPEHLTPARGRAARRARQRARRRVRGAVRPRARGVPGARPPAAQAGSLRPDEPRPLGPREPRRTATSRRRSAATPISSSTARSCSELGVSDEPLPEDLRDARRAGRRSGSARLAQVEYKADAICLAWLLERRLFEEGWEAAFDGEIIGRDRLRHLRSLRRRLRGLRPGAQLPGDYYELNPLATALVGRRSGFAYRLGDPIRVRVERIEKPGGRGRVSSLSGNCPEEENLALCEKAFRGPLNRRGRGR